MQNKKVNPFSFLLLGCSTDGVDVMEQFNSSDQGPEIRSFHNHIRRVSSANLFSDTILTETLTKVFVSFVNFSVTGHSRVNSKLVELI